MPKSAKWKRHVKPQYEPGLETKIGPYFKGWGYEDLSTHYWMTTRELRSRSDKYKNIDRTTIRKFQGI